MDVRGKATIITGSAQGLGKAFALRLLAAGARVLLSDLNQEAGLATLAELRAAFGEDRVAFARCDVTDHGQLEALFDACEKELGGKVDIFCNNAGINTNWGWRKCMEVNVMAAMDAMEVALARMEGRGGLVVNTASLAGVVPGWTRGGHSYFAGKHAVLSMTRTLGSRDVFQETGVKVQAICPCFADTAIIDDKDGGAKYREQLAATTGILAVEEVAEGFMQLVQNCGNGAAVIVYPNSPPLVWHDTNFGAVLALATVSRAVKAVTGVRLFHGFHQALAIIAALLILHVLFGYFFF